MQPLWLIINPILVFIGFFMWGRTDRKLIDEQAKSDHFYKALEQAYQDMGEQEQMIGDLRWLMAKCKLVELHSWENKKSLDIVFENSDSSTLRKTFSEGSILSLVNSAVILVKELVDEKEKGSTWTATLS